MIAYPKGTGKKYILTPPFDPNEGAAILNLMVSAVLEKNDVKVCQYFNNELYNNTLTYKPEITHMCSSSNAVSDYVK